MTTPALRQAAQQLAKQLRIPPQQGGVWTWIENGTEEILVELRRDAAVAVPHVFNGFRVVVRDRLNPAVRGIHLDL